MLAHFRKTLDYSANCYCIRDQEINEFFDYVTYRKVYDTTEVNLVIVLFLKVTIIIMLL